MWNLCVLCIILIYLIKSAFSEECPPFPSEECLSHEIRTLKADLETIISKSKSPSSWSDLSPYGFTADDWIRLERLQQLQPINSPLRKHLKTTIRLITQAIRTVYLQNNEIKANLTASYIQSTTSSINVDATTPEENGNTFDYYEVGITEDEWNVTNLNFIPETTTTAATKSNDVHKFEDVPLQNTTDFSLNNSFSYFKNISEILVNVTTESIKIDNDTTLNTYGEYTELTTTESNVIELHINNYSNTTDNGDIYSDKSTVQINEIKISTEREKWEEKNELLYTAPSEQVTQIVVENSTTIMETMSTISTNEIVTNPQMYNDSNEIDVNTLIRNEMNLTMLTTEFSVVQTQSAEVLQIHINSTGTTSDVQNEIPDIKYDNTVGNYFSTPELTTPAFILSKEPEKFTLFDNTVKFSSESKASSLTTIGPKWNSSISNWLEHPVTDKLFTTTDIFVENFEFITTEAPSYVKPHISIDTLDALKSIIIGNIFVGKKENNPKKDLKMETSTNSPHSYDITKSDVVKTSTLLSVSEMQSISHGDMVDTNTILGGKINLTSVPNMSMPTSTDTKEYKFTISESEMTSLGTTTVISTTPGVIAENTSSKHETSSQNQTTGMNATSDVSANITDTKFRDFITKLKKMHDSSEKNIILRGNHIPHMLNTTAFIKLPKTSSNSINKKYKKKNTLKLERRGHVINNTITVLPTGNMASSRRQKQHMQRAADTGNDADVLYKWFLTRFKQQDARKILQRVKDGEQMPAFESEGFRIPYRVNGIPENMP